MKEGSSEKCNSASSRWSSGTQFSAWWTELKEMLKSCSSAKFSPRARQLLIKMEERWKINYRSARVRIIDLLFFRAFSVKLLQREERNSSGYEFNLIQHTSQRSTQYLFRFFFKFLFSLFLLFLFLLLFSSLESRR